MSWSYLQSGAVDHVGQVGQVLVCLHGVGGDANAFAPQLTGLSSSSEIGQNIQVWSLNMPGYGSSAPLPVMDWDHLVAGLKQFLDQHQLPKVYLLGHSFGGMLAQAFAAQHPSYLAGLILYSTSPAFGSDDGAFQKQFIQARLKPLDEGQSMAQLAASLIDPLLAQPSAPHARQAAIECMAQVPSHTYRQAIKCISLFECRHNLPHLKLPTLLLAGAADQTASPAMMQRMANKIAGAKMCVLPNASHLANLEQATLFNQHVSDFIRHSSPHQKGSPHAT